jgi:hypothetical protein
MNVNLVYVITSPHDVRATELRGQSRCRSTAKTLA